MFCSIAAAGETQGGWENARIAALVHDPQLAPKIERHGADEDKHGRIFRALLRERGLAPVEVPLEVDYCGLLERQGIGLRHERLRSKEPLVVEEVIWYLAFSRVTEQRASEEMRLLLRVFSNDSRLGKAIRVISKDEDKHLAYCHEELLRLAATGHAELIRDTLHAVVRAEIRVYRDVSLAVMARMGELLKWPHSQRLMLALGIQIMYGYERLYGWRRLVQLRMPKRRNALGVGTRLEDPPASPA